MRRIQQQLQQRGYASSNAIRLRSTAAIVMATVRRVSASSTSRTVTAAATVVSSSSIPASPSVSPTLSARVEEKKAVRVPVARTGTGAKRKEEQMLDFVLATATKGDPQSVMDTIDAWGWTNWMMNIGNVKGVYLDDAIRAKQPKWVMELGAYCGYSAVRIARLLPPGGKVISVDPSDWANKIARQIVEHAGLTSRVEYMVTTSGDAIPQVKTKFGMPQLDLVLIDHAQSMFLHDLHLLEQHALVTTGTVVVADNVIYPGAPDYLKYVRTSPLYQTTFHDTLLEYTNDQRDGVAVSIRR